MNVHPLWHSGRAASGGEEIYYEITGPEGLPVVMLTHGAGGNHVIWYQQVPALVAAGFRVLTWDARGFGNSSYTTGVHGTAAAVADMEVILRDESIDRVHLVGQSMGGWWVTAFTLAFRERVASLTLCNTVGGLWTDALLEHFTTHGLDQEPHPFAHPALGPDTPETVAFLYQELNTFHSPPMRDILRAIMSTRVAHADLDACNVPTLMITSFDDQLFPQEFVAQSAELLHNARLVTIEGAGHSAYFEKPVEFNTSLLSFLSEISSR